MGSSEGRLDLTPLKIKIFEAICGFPSRTDLSPCKQWALYRNGFRLYMLGELAKCELDAIVLYTLGKDNVHLHNELVRALLHNSSLPKAPLLSTVLPYLDDAMRQAPDPAEAFSDDEDSEDDDDGDNGREEGLALYETLRKALDRSGPAWDRWHGGGIGLPCPLDKREGSTSTIPHTRDKGAQDKAGETDGGNGDRACGGGLAKEGGQGLLSLACYGSSDESEAREGEGEERLLEGWREGGGGGPACLPTLALVHHTLMCAGSQASQQAGGRRGEEGEGGRVKSEGDEGGPIDRPITQSGSNMVNVSGPMAVSMQATATLHSAAQEFTRRLLRRCVSLAHQEGTSPPSPSSPNGRKRSSPPSSPSSSSPNGRKRRAADHSPPFPPSPPPSQRPSPLPVHVVEACVVLQCVHDPSLSPSPSFPSPDLATHLYALTHY